MTPTAVKTPSKSRFIIINGNMLGSYNRAMSPLSAQILTSINGAVSDWRNGMYPLPLDPQWVRSNDCPKPLDLAKVRDGSQHVVLDAAFVRPATRADFETFRLVSTGYEKDTAHYDFPTA